MKICPISNMAIEIAEFTRKIAIFDDGRVRKNSNLVINSPYSIFGLVTSNIRGDFPMFEVTVPAPPFLILRVVVIL
jgi:hypothetical protein